MGFVERINELFGERGSQARCSKGTGIAESLLSNYKNNKAEPSLSNAVLIADFFDVSLDWLAGRDGYARDAHRNPSPSEIDALCSRMDDDSRAALLTMARNAAALSGVRERDRGRVAEGAVIGGTR